MIYRVVVALVLLSSFALSSSVASPSPSSTPEPEPTPPYWKAKKEVYKKMKEERYIAVSAHSNSVGDKKKLTVTCAGIIHAPVAFAHDTIMIFDQYPKFLSYILESPYDKTSHNVFLHGAIMGYHVHMTIHTDVESKTDEKKIKWKSIEGGFKGMEGVILEKGIDENHTEISFDSSYVGESLGIPAFILDWGLEFAAQRTAANMRSHIESEWENSKKH
jgi:ribosome-associated toxin RatA of RatAB toxin-antitoxin module